MKKSLIMLVGGLLLGALATVYFLGTPRGHGLPGTLVKPPDPSGAPSGTVAVSVDEKFFDSLLGTIFTKLGPPQLKLSQIQPAQIMQPAAFQSSCNDMVVLNPEAGSV